MVDLENRLRYFVRNIVAMINGLSDSLVLVPVIKEPFLRFLKENLLVRSVSNHCFFYRSFDSFLGP